MKVVHVAPFYSPVLGGVEEVVKKIAEYLVSKGYDIQVVTYNRLRDNVASLPRYETINGVHVIRLKPNFIWSHGTFSSELPEVLRELRPDIVHVHAWRHPHVFQVAKLRNSLKFKAILHGHAPFHRFNQLGSTTWLYHRLIDTFFVKYLKLYEMYIALTPYEAEKVENVGFDKSRVIVIPNGVDEDNCQKDACIRNENQVLYLGRISKSKNIELLVKSMAYIARAKKEAKLILAGPDEGIAKNLVEYAGKRNLRLSYLGAVSDAKKHELYLKSYVYAFPSIYEPFGITLLEASQHKLPSIITGYGGQHYVAPPGLVSLWSRSEPRDYAKAITMLLEDKDLWKKLSENAFKWSENFLWSKILPKYEELYESIEEPR